MNFDWFRAGPKSLDKFAHEQNIAGATTIMTKHAPHDHSNVSVTTRVAELYSAVLKSSDVRMKEPQDSISATSGAFEAKLKQQLSDQKAEYKLREESIVGELRDLRTRIEDLTHITGNIAVTENYRQIATAHARVANSLRIGATALLLLMAGVFVYISLGVSDVELEAALFRCTGALILFIPARYLARESSKHRDLATCNRRIELELSSLEPFIATLKGSQKRKLKIELVQKYFCRKEPPELDKGITSAGSMLETLKIFLKALKDK